MDEPTLVRWRHRHKSTHIHIWRPRLNDPVFIRGGLTYCGLNVPLDATEAFEWELTTYGWCRRCWRKER